jgi:hypothetical protein
MLDLVGGVSFSVSNTGTEGATPLKRESEDKAVPQPAQQDTVQISTSAKVQALDQEGQSVSQIANTLGLTATEVEQYLNMTSEIMKAALQAAAAAAVK